MFILISVRKRECVCAWVVIGNDRNDECTESKWRQYFYWLPSFRFHNFITYYSWLFISLCCHIAVDTFNSNKSMQMSSFSPPWITLIFHFIAANYEHCDFVVLIAILKIVFPATQHRAQCQMPGTIFWALKHALFSAKVSFHAHPLQKQNKEKKNEKKGLPHKCSNSFTDNILFDMLSQVGGRALVFTRLGLNLRNFLNAWTLFAFSILNKSRVESKKLRKCSTWN